MYILFLYTYIIFHHVLSQETGCSSLCRITDVENRLVVAKGEGEGEGWTGSLGLIDANSYILNG